MAGGAQESLFIGIAGLIGAGKTTLAAHLAAAMGLPVHHEPVADQPYLVDFYSNMRRYSFPMQVYLLNRRFQQHQQIIWQGRGAVQDRTIYEDSVFAGMLRDAGMMDDRDYRTYTELFTNMANFLRKPNVIVYLDVHPAKSLERIRARGRKCEEGITLEYLEGLYAAYEKFIGRIARVIPVIRVDWNEFRAPEEMAALIRAEYEKVQTVHWV